MRLHIPRIIIGIAALFLLGAGIVVFVLIKPNLTSRFGQTEKTVTSEEPTPVNPDVTENWSDPTKNQDTNPYLVRRKNATQDLANLTYSMIDESLADTREVLIDGGPIGVNRNEAVSVKKSETEVGIYLVDIGMLWCEVGCDAFGPHRGYYVNLNTNTVRPDTNALGWISYSKCSIFDSKRNSRWEWACGEGIGSSIPLSEVSLKSGVSRIVVDSAILEKVQFDVELIYKDGIFEFRDFRADKILGYVNIQDDSRTPKIYYSNMNTSNK